MNKTTRTVIIVVLAVLAVLILALCQNALKPNTPPNAAEIWNKIDEAMSSVTSMELTVTTNRVYYQDDNRYEFTGTKYVLSTTDAHYTESKSMLVCEAMELEETLQQVDAYYGGKLYRSVQSNGYNQKLCSAMTHEEYDQMHSGEPTNEIPLIGCNESAVSGSESDGWVLTFSGYESKNIEQTIQNFGLSQESLGGVIVDMKVVISVSADYHVKTIDVTFAFEDAEGENTPSISVNTAYTGYNEVVFDPARLNQEEYVEVEDIRLLDKLSQDLVQLQNAQLGQFELTKNTTEVYHKQTTTYKEQSTMIYGWKDSRYFYLSNNILDGKTSVVHYENGKQTIVSDDPAYPVAVPEVEAKAFVDGLIDTARYDPFAIKSIEKVSDGVYLLTSDRPNLADYETAGMELSTSNQQIAVTYENGKLVKIESILAFSAIYQEQTVEVKTEATIVFTEITEVPEM